MDDPPAAAAAAARAPGFRGVVASLAGGQVLSWAVLYYAFSSFVLPMSRDLGWDEPTLMGAFTLGLAVWGLASYAVGAAVDRGRGRLVMTAGALLGAAGCLLWSQVRTPLLLYAAWGALGAAMAMTLYEPAFGIVTRRYPQRYRDAITALTLVGGFASTLSFPAATWLIGAFGWRDALLALAALMALGVAPLHAWALRGEASGAAAPRAGADAADATLHEALRERAFWLLALAFTLHAFAGAALWAHVMPAFAAKGFSEAQALAVVVWIGPAQVAGRLAWAWLGRGVTLRALGVTVLAAMPLALALFALGTQLAALFAFALLFGVANGLATIVRGGVVPQLYGRASVGRIGGAMSAFGLLARAAAPLATAWLLLALPGYREAMLVLAALGVLAVAAFAAARR